MSHNSDIKKQNQWTLILLVVAFVVPVIAAYLMYLNIQDHGGPGSTRNHGTLVRPARPLQQVNLQSIQGELFSKESFTGKWSLLYIDQGQCDKTCQTNLSRMHQTRLAQGQAMSRVQLIYVAQNGYDKSELLAEKFKPLKIISGHKKNIREFINLFQLNSDEDVLQMKRIYMIDPLGNLMMRYESGFALPGLIKDLEHLLKTSHIG